MIPVIAIVGRPNVGKSTLFNQLTRSRNALVIDFPGVTRDRQYGEGRIAERSFIVCDTGGLGEDKPHEVFGLMEKQAWAAIDEADIIFFVVDARTGLTSQDEDIARKLREKSKRIQLVVNKIDGLNEDTVLLDFYRLGLGEPTGIAASHGIGITQLVTEALDQLEARQLQEEFSQEENIDEEETKEPFQKNNIQNGELIQLKDNVLDMNLREPFQEEITETNAKRFDIENSATKQILDVTESSAKRFGIKLGIVGRPNVGKSTLVNRFLGEERVIVFDEPGTTRDSIYIPFERHGQLYTLIDTAGVRRKARVKESIEKFSVIKTLQAIKSSDVVILMIDARHGMTDQDLALLDFIHEEGRALVIAINKWDGLSEDDKKSIKRELYRLEFVNFAKIHFISALHGSGVGDLFQSVIKAYQSATKELSTAKLTRALEEIVASHAPPMIQGRRIKLRYAHAGGHSPPLIVIHGNQTEHVPETYRRYLMNSFRKALKLQGTPIRIEFKTSKNPYEGKRNKLTPRQEYKRKRLRDFVKRKK